MSKVSTGDVIKYAAYFTSVEGYIKRSEDKDNCTANKIIDAIELDSVDESEISNTSHRISEWLNYINNENNSGEYFDNVRSEIAKPMIDEIKIGLIASSFASMDKNKLLSNYKNRDTLSKYIGEEGDTVSFNITDYKFMKSGKSKFNSSYWYLYKIYSNDNVIMYFSDHNIDDDLKNSTTATATINKLCEFNGCKQTNVSNLRFE